MKTSVCVSVRLTEEETYEALEQYIRAKMTREGKPLGGYKVDDADSACKDKDNGAYFFFVKDEE